MKAIIIREGRLLVTANRDEEGLFYLLPGGGQRWGETMTQTLLRECWEELGVEVEVEELLFVREYIGAHHEFAHTDGGVHQLEFMFLCRLIQGAEPQGPLLPDHWQVGIAWLPIEKLERYRLYPRALIRPLKGLVAGKPTGPWYLGDVN